MSRSRKAVICSVWLTLCCPMLMLAQAPYGSIVGRVLDSAEARVPEARVLATNLATSVQTEARTNAEGNYELRTLVPGLYRVGVEMKGFKRLEREPIEVRVGDVLTLDVTLELGEITERVTVTSEAPLLESSTASLGQVVDSRRVHDLPRSGASVIYLMQLTPGVVGPAAPTSFWTPNNFGRTSSLAVSGSRPGQTLYAIDGNPINNITSTTLSPFPEMIQEVRVQTNAVDASVGRFTGAHVNMITKTGTNDFHGDIVYTFMNQGLIAQDFFTKQSINDPATGPITQEKIDQAWPKQKITRFRPSGGGPVYLPGLYDGRNRTFWTYGMDFMTFVRNEPTFSTVPTKRQRLGDFSELLNLGSQYQLYDPATITPLPNGRFQRSPLLGNIIPPSLIHPMAKRLLEYWPLPNVAGTSEGRNNHFDPSPANEPYFAMMGRVDHVINQSNRFFGSFTWMHMTPSFGDPFHSGATGFLLDRNQRGLTFSDVVTSRPNLLLDLRYGLIRFTEVWPSPSRGFDLASLGFQASLVSRLDPRETTLPGLNISDYTPIGGGGQPSTAVTHHTFGAQAIHHRGNHSLRFGGEIRVLQRNGSSFVNNSPQYTFDSTWTGGPLDSSPGPPMGAGLAAFMLGFPSGGFIDRLPTFAQTSKYLGVYLQDDWKLTRNLTLNLGLRYEVNLPTTERFNRTVRGFDFVTPNPIQEAARANYALNPVPEIPIGNFQTLGGLKFAGLQGTLRGLWDTDRNNFIPRIGLAYLLRPTTVLRASYGIFFEPVGADRNFTIQSGFARRTDLVPTLDNGRTFRATLNNPFPDGIIEPVGAAAGLRTFLGQSLSSVWPQLREPYLQRWSFNIEQAFPQEILLDVGYVGSRSVGLGISEQLNPTPAQFLSKSPARDQATIDYLGRQVPNPFFGLAEFQGTALQSTTISRAQLLKPYPHFIGMGSTLNGGYSSYHSLQARVEKRFSHGWTLQASYTWSKLIEAVSRLNPTDPVPEYVVSTSDRAHYFTLHGVYEFPFGRGRRWLSSSGWQSKLLGGWSFLALYTAASGPPLNFGNIIFNGNIKDIPLPSSARTVDRWFNTGAGFERDSRKQLGSNIRTFPTRLSNVRADGFNVMNMSLFKTIKLHERVSIRFEAEVLDIFNTPLWGAPNTNPVSSLFGRVTALQGDTTQRRATLGARLTW